MVGARITDFATDIFLYMTTILKIFTVPSTTKLDILFGVPIVWVKWFIAAVQVASRFVMVGINQINLAKFRIIGENL